MGGYGSTRWEWHTKKDTVEDCRVLDIKELVDDGKLAAHATRRGFIWWRTSTVGYRISAEADAGVMSLEYRIKNSNESIDYDIKLQTTRPNFGGLRWYFSCPLITSGGACQRRVSKLYLPYFGRYFGCRQCYDLTYQSSQESDKRLSALRNNPEAMYAALQSDNASQQFLALRASIKY